MKRALFSLLILGCLQVATCKSSPAAISPAVMQKLTGGATLVTRTDKIAPRVAISLLVRAGASNETVQNAGWRQVLAGAMLRATKLPDGKIRSTSEWQALGETWGGQFGATTGEDFIELWARGDSAFASQLLESLLQIASSPRLSDADIAWARRRALEIVGQPETGVARRAADAIGRSLYRDDKGTPLAYALPDYGTFESL
jgi:predicted Zn-dependent peptidase